MINKFAKLLGETHANKQIDNNSYSINLPIIATNKCSLLSPIDLTAKDKYCRHSERVQ